MGITNPLIGFSQLINEYPELNHTIISESLYVLVITINIDRKTLNERRIGKYLIEANPKITKTASDEIWP